MWFVVDATSRPRAGDRRSRANELIAYHSPISHLLTAERTSYQSQMIPVTPYILVACAETFSRYPEMMRTIAAAMAPEDIGRAGRVPGSQINTVYLWSIANFYLVGRKMMTQFDPSLDGAEDAATVLEFWDGAARGFRGDGTRQAVDAGGSVRVYADELVAEVVSALQPIDDDNRPVLRRFNASLISYLFLLYFDTRVGSGDTGPYLLDDGRTMVLRDFYRMGVSDFPWSDVAAEVPYQHLLMGLALDGVELTISDFGTSRTDPEDYLERLSGACLFTTDGCDPGRIRPVPLDEIAHITTAVRRAEVAHYRRIAAMTPDEMIRCGAYVYFTFLRPFAEAAGVADELDWTVPRDLPQPVYDLVVALGADLGAADLAAEEDPLMYYAPIAEGS